MLTRFVDFIIYGISLKFILQCLIAICMGIFVSISLILSGQTWAKTFSNITTYCILPLIGLVITTVISGNIALSLGMVGALSIIRFRHPVKSPLELSIYFLLLTLGITISTSVGKAFVLLIFSMTIIYSYSFYRRKKISNKGYLDTSFSSEEKQYILEINCDKKNEYLANNLFLLFSNEDYIRSIFTYKLSFLNKDDVDSTKKEIELLKGIKDIKFSIL